MPTRSIVTLLLSGLLSACIVVTDHRDDDESWEDDSGSWQARQRQNREAIEGLQLGLTLEAVRAQLGAPEFSEALRIADRDYRVLRYRTQHRHADGDTTEDETTPLVFENGVLIGWGESVLASILR